MKEKINGEMPELPDARRVRFATQYGLSAYDAGVLTGSRALAEYFETTVKAGAAPKTAANWISTELLRRLNESTKDIEKSPVAPGALAELLAEIEAGRITAASGKKVFTGMFETGRPAAEIIGAEGLATLSDTGEIERAAREIIEQNPNNVAKFRAGNEGVFKFFVGQVMRATRGQADPQTVNDTLRRLLAS
jgi:aspartyl-tRNA(Asn)/glutamyl-tRNA(Gln) amidotransferase subunit B